MPKSKAKAKPKAKTKAKAKAKPNAKAKAGAQSLHSDANVEQHGVIIVYCKTRRKSVKWFKHLGGNMMQICSEIEGPDLIINSVYAPHNGPNSVFEKREKWYAYLTEVILAHNNCMQLTIGDLSARLHAKREEDTHIGPHVFRKGH